MSESYGTGSARRRINRSRSSPKGVCRSVDTPDSFKRDTDGSVCPKFVLGRTVASSKRWNRDQLLDSKRGQVPMCIIVFVHKCRYL